MASFPMPQQDTPPPQQQPQGDKPDVSQNVMPIANQAKQAGQPTPGVTEAQMGNAPQARATEGPSKKRMVLSILGAAAGLGPMVQQVNQKHNQDMQIRNQHIIDDVWGAHNNETQARNRIKQLQPIAEDIKKHMEEAQALPNDDPSKIMKLKTLAGYMQGVTAEVKQQAGIIQASQTNLQALLADPKNRKILSKAVGYDEKNANTPERQQMVAAIQKSIPGTSPEEAQMESQFPQGASAGQPGLTPEVQKQVLQSATEQAKIEGRQGVADTRSGAQVETAQIRADAPKAAGKTGVQLNRGVPYGWTASDGKHYTASDPSMPEEGKEAIGDAMKAYLKSKGDSGAGKVSGLALYTITRMLSIGYHNNPAILGAVGDLARSAGLNLPNSTLQTLAQVPLGQPLSPETGQPIGTGMPGAPTSSTRNQAQTAQRVLTEIPRLRNEIQSATSSLGPVQGRAVIGFLLGRVGTTGDPQKDEQLNQLRTDLAFAASASAKFHINSVRAVEEFDRLANAGKDTAPALQGFMNAVQAWAQTAAAQQHGYGETAGGQGGNSAQHKVGDIVEVGGRRVKITGIGKDGKATGVPVQ